MEHKETIKRFRYHKIRHRYLKQNKSPNQIAGELNLDYTVVYRTCAVIFNQEVLNYGDDIQSRE